MMEAPPRAYARVAYETAVDEWLDALRTVHHRIVERDLTPVLDDPLKPFEEKRAILDELLNPDTDTRIRNFIYTLASNNDINLLEDIIEDYERLLRQGDIELPLAEITSAIPLTEAEQQRIEQKLRQRFGEELDVRFRVDPSILGGLTIRIGDKYIDGSIATKLEAMREQLGVRQ